MAFRQTSASTLSMGDTDHPMKSLSRALVLASAVEHIKSLKSDSARATNFGGALQTQVKGLRDLDLDIDFALQCQLHESSQLYHIQYRADVMLEVGQPDKHAQHHLERYKPGQVHNYRTTRSQNNARHLRCVYLKFTVYCCTGM